MHIHEKISAAIEKVKDIGNKIISGRQDYSPSTKSVLNKYGNEKVLGISLHRQVLPSVYTKILSVWTKGETERRLKQEPKDNLFHIL
jgi:hypothetical protein